MILSSLFLRRALLADAVFSGVSAVVMTLDAAALAIIGVVVDVALRGLHQPRDRGLAQACGLLGGLRFGSDFHGIMPPGAR